MSICGTRFNLSFTQRTETHEEGDKKIMFFESHQDCWKFTEFPYKKISLAGGIGFYKNYLKETKIEAPEWANFFAIEQN